MVFKELHSLGAAYMRRSLALVLMTVIISIPHAHSSEQSVFPRVQFLGAAQMVGGASYLIDTGKTRLLVDCGLFYGAEHQDKNKQLQFDPASIDFVLLTHAHIDHAGRIPLLYKKGFTGQTIGTDATKDISGIMLEMSMDIARETPEPLFDFPDYKNFMDRYRTVDYGRIVELSTDVSIRLVEAGHILGSAIAEIWIKTDKGQVKIVVASDLGHKGTPILRDPAYVSDADYVIIESTYGTVNRRPFDYHEFGAVIQDTLKSGGSVLIPAFVLEKTQKVLFTIGKLKREGVIPADVPVYADSTSASRITWFYAKYKKYYDDEALGLLSDSNAPLAFQGLSWVSGKQSRAINTAGGKAIYLTSSGMMDHGNAPRLLEVMATNPKNLLLIVGWQSPESLGRTLQEGARLVSFPIEEYERGVKTTRTVNTPVLMKVQKFDGFSSHADGAEIMNWLAHLASTRKVFVVHGEKASALGLAGAIHEQLGFNASAPAMQETVILSSETAIHKMKKPVTINAAGKRDDDVGVSGGICDQ